MGYFAQTMNDQRKTKNNLGSKHLFGVAIYVFVVSLPGIVATLVNQELTGNGRVYYSLMISGITAYAMIAMQFVLTARIKWIVKTFGFRNVLRFHMAMAIVATILVFLHVGLLIWSVGNWNLVLSPWVIWPIQLGRIVVIALVVTLAISFGRKFLPISYANWRWFHNALAWTILILGFVHSMIMGTSFDNMAFAMIWMGYFASAIIAWSWRRYYRVDKPRHPKARHR